MTLRYWIRTVAEVTVTRVSRAEQMARTRARLLEAAREVFLMRGLSAATIEEISERAGVTRGAVYKHFASKETIYVELLHASTQPQAEQIRAAVFASSGADDLIDLIVNLLSAIQAERSANVFDSAEIRVKAGTQPALLAQVLEVQQVIDEVLGEIMLELARRLDVRPSLSQQQLGFALAALLSSCASRAGVDGGFDASGFLAATLRALVGA